MSDISATTYLHEHQHHWDSVAEYLDQTRWRGRYYQQRLAEVFLFSGPPGLRVLELGCGTGTLLASLQPRFGIGIDFSREMLNRAREQHPELTFIQADAHSLPVRGQFDVIILSDLINDLWDAQAVFAGLGRLVHRRTRIIVNFFSRMWEWPLALAQKLGIAKPNLQQNWFTVADVEGLLELTGLEAVRRWQEILLPVGVPLAAELANRYLVKLWPFRHLAVTNFILARPLPEIAPPKADRMVSVVIPARNEAGNIERVFNEIPLFGEQLELIFVEGHSTDGTYEAIERNIASHPMVSAKLLKQSGIGKGDAVRCGFECAVGDVLMILDADLSVAPQDLPRFYDALISGRGDFVNGVRLVYPMEERAMRIVNLAGNKLFGWTISWLLGQKIRDTLCGTKVLWKTDYDGIAANREYFGEMDPFGDYDLLFGAAKLGLKIVDMPIRYRQRRYGQTNIQRWRHGWLLMKMLAIATRRLKFV